MTTHGHLIKFTVEPGQRETFVALMQPMFAAVENEPGTLLYLLHSDSEDPNVLWLYERYVDEAAFEAHRGSPVHGQVVAALLDQIDPVAEMSWMELISGKGLPADG